VYHAPFTPRLSGIAPNTIGGFVSCHHVSRIARLAIEIKQTGRAAAVCQLSKPIDQHIKSICDSQIIIYFTHPLFLQQFRLLQLRFAQAVREKPIRSNTCLGEFLMIQPPLMSLSFVVGRLDRLRCLRGAWL